MKIGALLLVISATLLSALVITGCTVQNQAAAFCHNELVKAAKEYGIEISRIKIETAVMSVSPAEEMNGIQARVSIRARFAYKFTPDSEWRDGDLQTIADKTKGKWSMPIVDRAYLLPRPSNPYQGQPGVD